MLSKYSLSEYEDQSESARIHLLQNAAADSTPEAINLVREIIESGISPDAYSDVGTSPLIYAAMYGTEETIEYLLSVGADIDLCAADEYDRLLNALRTVCKTKRLSIAKLLLVHQANPNLENSQGLTAIHMLCDNGTDECKEVLELLLPITDKKYLQKAYQFCSNSVLKRAVHDYCQTHEIALVEPKRFGGSEYLDFQRADTPPTDRLRRQLWKCLNYYIESESDPNESFDTAMLVHQLGGSQESMSSGVLLHMMNSRLYGQLLDGLSYFIRTKHPSLFKSDVWTLQMLDEIYYERRRIPKFNELYLVLTLWDWDKHRGAV
jgi:ankyrin repeat protein